MDIVFTHPTPPMAPFPAQNFYRLTPSEKARRSLRCVNNASEAPCELPVRIGLFFDGTNNNLSRDRYGERIDIDGHVSLPPTTKPLPDSERSHSNVARLFEAYAKTDHEKGVFSYYIPGVGTRFDWIGEPTETPEGKAFAKGGEARIMYALVQVVNSIYTALTARPRFSLRKAGELAQEYEKSSGKNGERERASRSKLVDFFAIYMDELNALVRTKEKPKIPSLVLDVFGFSRGGAEAVAFCHMFNELLIDGRFASLPATIGFLGVFDVVASVGISFSVSLTTIVPEVMADGHLSWAKRILDPLPACVRSGRHFIAAHEQRMNFPVTAQLGSLDLKQIYFPGVHSDVGGGYGPGESGKAMRAQSELLSQIPLAYMYKEAFIEGVPFLDFDALESSVKEDFSISAALAVAWEAYTSALKVNGDDHGDRFRTHMSLYYRWRKLRLYNLEKCDFYKAASKQAQQDMSDSNNTLKCDFEVLRERIALSTMGPQLSAERRSAREFEGASQWQTLRADQPATDWEKWVMSQFDRTDPLDPDVVIFFDNYVHDSIAGFYLAGEVTEFDKRKKVEEIKKKDRSKLSGFDLKIYDLAKEAEAAQQKAQRGEKLSEAEQSLVDEAKTGTPYPVMTDADTKSMRSAAILTQTSSRREGGGYLMPRFYFPRVRSFIHKEFKYQELLDREAHNIRRPDHDYPETSTQIASNKKFGNDHAGLADTAG